MFRKTLACVLVVLMLNAVGAVSAYAAGSEEEKEARFAERVRAGISKLGTGPEARVEVKLRSKTKLKGYVSESNTESFTVVGASGTATIVPYPQVGQVKGHNLSDGARIAIVAGIVVVALVLTVTLFAGN